MLTDRLPAALQRVLRGVVDLLMLSWICLFVVVYGTKLCLETWARAWPSCPGCRWASPTALPLGSHHLLFVLERHLLRPSTPRRGALRPCAEGREACHGRLRAAGQLLRAHADGHAGGLCAGPGGAGGRLWIDLPLDAVMIQIASGVNKFSLLAIPFFVLAGAIMAEGGMSRRLVAFAGVLVGFHPRRPVAGQHPGVHLFRRHLGLVGGRHRLHRLGADPRDGKEGLPARLSPPRSPSAARCRPS
jgi:hypothetical protein